jgi:hypothetical protein
MKKTCILLVWTLVGCSGTMSHSAAANAIRSHFAQDRQFVLLNVGRVGADCIFNVNGKETHVDWTPEKEISTVTAVAAGYFTVTQDGPGFWKVALTEQGTTAMKAAGETLGSPETGNGCVTQSFELPIASPELVQVTGVTADEMEPQVEYTWRWKASDLGRSLRKDGRAYATMTPSQREHLNWILVGTPRLPIPIPAEDQIFSGTMKFKKYTDGWRPQ